MSKILKSLQFVTQSTSPSTPATGTGAIFASGSSIYFENVTGTVYDLAASNGYIVTRSYTGSTDGTNAIYTWEKPSALKYLEICCIGAGGGGASGRITNVNTQLASSGGGGGAIVYQLIESARLSSTYTITVGGGGTPGARRITNGAVQTGSVGSNGGKTSFGTLVVAAGGQGGQITANGGTGLVVAFGGNVANCVPPFGPWAISGLPSGMTNTTPASATPRAALNRGNSPPVAASATWNASGSWGFGAAGGGNGACRSTVLVIGTSGSGVVVTTNAGAPGANNTVGVGSNGSNGRDNISLSFNRLLRYSSSANLINVGLGSGGGGGGAGITGGGTGGNGGYYGAGGGGGGLLFGLGSLAVPSSSGAGGSGSSGLCLLIEYY
jgi:hypothetical protein